MSDRIPRAALVVATVVCCSTVVSHIFGRATYSILLSAISEDLVSSFTAAGFLGSANFSGYLIGVVIVTAVSGRIEPIWLLRSGLAIAAVALAVLSITPSFSLLTVGILLAGMAGAGIWVTAPNIATRGVPASRRGLILGLLTASMGVGMLAVSLGTNAYRSRIGDESAWRPVFGIEAVVTVAILGAAFLLVRPAPTEKMPESHTMFSAVSLRSIPHWVLLTVAYTVFSALAGSWTQFLGLALEEDAGFDRSTATALFSVVAVAGFFGPLCLGWLSDRIGRDYTLAVGCAVAAIASLLLTTGANPAVTIAVALYGFASYSIPVLTAASVRDHLTDRPFGTAYGLITIIYALGSLASAQLGGWLADVTGSFTVTYWCLAAAAAISGAISIVRGRRLAQHKSSVVIAG